MFIRTLDEVAVAGRIFSLLNDTVRSARFINAEEGLGFSYNYSRVRKGADEILWYKNHWEANYIISGRGEVTDLTSGEKRPLEPGVLYVVGPNDRHRWHITEDEQHVSIFCPPLRGDERHDEDGSFPASGPAPQTDRRMFVRYADEMRAEGKELTLTGGGARSLRMLTKSDELGFSFSVVHSTGGRESNLWYKNHWEANHVIEGSAEVTDLATGQVWKLGPGVSYNVGPKDRHVVRTHTDMVLISVFCPPLQGDEMHNADGTLAPSGPIPPGPLGY